MASATTATAADSRAALFKLGQFRSIESWAKNVLVLQMLPDPGMSLCELFADDRDVSKWLAAQPSFVCCINGEESELAAAQGKFTAKGSPCESLFLHASPYGDELWLDSALQQRWQQHQHQQAQQQQPGAQALAGEGLVDVAFCFNSKLTRTWAERETADAFLRNVAQLVKIGGYFVGHGTDSSMVWYRSQRTLQTAVNNFTGALYGVKFMDNDECTPFGCRFAVELADGDTRHDVLVHFPTLTAMAASHGLRMIEITNLATLWEEHCDHYQDISAAWLVFQRFKDVPQETVDLLGLYCTFVFQRIR